jgi:hypothetical protein
MTTHSWIRRGLVLSVAIAMLIALAAAFSIGLTSPDPVTSTALGPDWQCTRLAFVLTTCSRTVHAEAAAASWRKDPPCARRTALVKTELQGC